MGIRSHAFGRVTLTDEDAAKFENQVRYGRPKAAAIESVKRGIKLSDQFQKAGNKVVITVHATVKAKGRRTA
jgi:hypothetical protein